MTDPLQLDVDAVVIAAPLEASRLTLDLPGCDPPVPHEYQRTITTFVQGELDFTYFGAPGPNDSEEGVQTVYLTKAGADKESWSSVARYKEPGADGHGLYKVFSHEPLKRATLDQLFQRRYTVLRSWDWSPSDGDAEHGDARQRQRRVAGAYPKFHPPEDMDSITPCGARKLVYLNALEAAVSAIEVSAISAKNGAAVVAGRIKSCTNDEAGEA